MSIIVHLFLSCVAVAATAYLLTGVRFDSVQAVFVTAIVLGLINTFLKPVLSFIFLPFNLITLGLFGLLINALIILALPHFITGFVVETFFSALLFSVILSLITMFFGVLRKK